jgi:ubiquinone/menaquinone biosynthesis C-methylase UbiE
MVGRLARIVEPLKRQVPAGGRILEFGCGTGDIAAQCASEGYKVDAVDLSTKMIERARSRFRIESVDFNACADTLKLPFAGGTFDAIVASSVLEYVRPIKQQLEELQRVCKVGGHSFITVPNMAHPLRWLEEVEKRIVIPIRGRLSRAWRARDEYLALSVNRQSLREWTELFTRTGWKVIATEQLFRPLMLIVAEKGATIASNNAKPV